MATTTISKLDGKLYFLCVGTDACSDIYFGPRNEYSALEEGHFLNPKGKYQVRCATPEDGVDNPSQVCIVNGTFWDADEALRQNLSGKNCEGKRMINSYRGSTVRGLAIPKSICQKIFRYI